MRRTFSNRKRSAEYLDGTPPHLLVLLMGAQWEHFDDIIIYFYIFKPEEDYMGVYMGAYGCGRCRGSVT
jgi:hypothetical protein